MKKILFLCCAIILLLSGCTFTVGGTLMIITIRDLLIYIVVAFVLAIIIAFIRPKQKRLSGFWIAFILGILLTPLASFIYLLILLTRRMKKNNEPTDTMGN